MKKPSKISVKTTRVATKRPSIQTMGSRFCAPLEGDLLKATATLVEQLKDFIDLAVNIEIAARLEKGHE